MRPSCWLLEEHDLPPVVAQAREVAVVGPVEEGAARGRGRRPAVALIVPVEMDLEGLAAGVVALQELVDDVRLPRARHQRRQPVLAREDPVISVCGLGHAGPAHDRRNAVAAFPVAVLLAAERRGAAVGPREGLGAVVGRVDHDRVVGDAEVVELLQELADLTVVLDHAVGIGPEPGHPRDSGLRWVKMCMRVELNQTKNGFLSSGRGP